MQIKRYANWGGAMGCLVVLQFVFPIVAEANGDKDCPRAESVGTDGVPIEFGQYQFADGGSDLVLSRQTENGTDIKRVTYSGGKSEGCLHNSVALAVGGGEDQWGWHLAWAGNQGLFYARMDGEAWVSSPPKRLTTAAASEIKLQVHGPKLLLRWHEQHGDEVEVYQAVSQDEGRNWEPPQSFHPAN